MGYRACGPTHGREAALQSFKCSYIHDFNWSSQHASEVVGADDVVSVLVSFGCVTSTLSYLFSWMALLISVTFAAVEWVSAWLGRRDVAGHTWLCSTRLSPSSGARVPACLSHGDGRAQESRWKRARPLGLGLELMHSFFKINLFILFIFGRIGSSLQWVGFSLPWLLLLRSMDSRSTGSVAVAHGLSCSVARGIFLDQGSNPCPLHWQADS